jgi:Short C-terminal domain
VSLRRLRYQLRCAASGHDTRPRLVGGSTVEHRCLRCGAVVGDLEPAASSPHGPSVPPGHGLVHAELRSAPRDGEPEATAADDDGEPDEDALTVLHALKELGELHAAGVVTDAEFADKKAELLRRV